MQKSAMLALTAALALALGATAPALAQGKKTGFASESTQGSSGKPVNQNASPNQQGTTTVSGPKGQLKKGNTDHQNVTVSGPGRSR